MLRVKNDFYMKLHKITKEQFIDAITDDPNDKFAKTFVSKANTGGDRFWNECYGITDGELMGAIIITISKRFPKIANLQLLHTFAKHRRKGVAKKLCLDGLKRVRQGGATYLRVSSEVPAVPFYESIGFKMLGEQKSKCQLSMFKIKGDTFFEGDYDINDPVIKRAVFSTAKGGCVRVFVEPEPEKDLFS